MKKKHLKAISFFLLFYSILAMTLTIVNLYLVKILSANLAFYIGNSITLVILLISIIIFTMGVLKRITINYPIYIITILLCLLTLLIFSNYYNKALIVN